MIDEQIDVRAIVFDVPGEDIGLGALEHQLLHSDFVDESRGHIGSPWIDVFGDPFASNMIISAPASRNRFVSAIAQLGSRVPSACNSAVAVAPPAPNCIPTSGLGFIPDLRINSIS